MVWAKAPESPKARGVPIQARAPGKLFLSGEYAVLEGGQAIACAVDRYVKVEFIENSVEEEPEVRRWREAAREVLRLYGLDPAPADRHVSIDSSELYSAEGSKYGLGSSAAVAVGLTGLLLSAGETYPPKSVQLRIAMDLHRAHHGPGGSGVDVAASLHGGTIAMLDGRLETLQWPAGLSCAVIWTGQAADTAQAVGRFRRALKKGGAQVEHALGRLMKAAESVRGRWALATRELLEALELYATALQELDRVAGLGIFSAAHRELRDLAESAGCVYKPSGAGGGDCGIAFARDSSAIEPLSELLRVEGFSVLDLKLAAKGLGVRTQAE